MKGFKSRNRDRNMRILAGACLAGGIVFTIPQFSHADVVIDVGLANSTTLTTTTTNATNGGINPVTYTPVQVTVADAPSENYDAADTSDPGTIWNSIQSVSTTPTVSVSPILYQSSLPLVTSTGAAISAELNVYALEGVANGKEDYLHSTSNAPATAGTDGLLPNPANSTYLVASVATNGNGYTASNAQRLLMGNEWVTNSTADGMEFEVTGLTAEEGDTFSLYVYGAGSVDGSGGTFTLASSNGGASATTNSNTAQRYLSVFDSTGVNPTPEKGLSWNLLSGVVDTNGDVTFSEAAIAGDSAKESINGFQLDVAVPEPTSIGLLALGSLGLLTRKRPKA
jgi:hypothetical protein